nr:UDP-N-acetylglucosamine 2-epimerase (non-hydrolyzing) [Janibacter cremeus]
MVVVGTRPEAIKMAPLARAMADSHLVQPYIVATGQHPGIVDVVFERVGLTVDADLGAGRPGLTLNELFAHILTGFQQFFFEEFGLLEDRPADRDYRRFPVACLVHGDTTSAAAVALAAFHLGLPVAHVEAGLRTGDIRSPFPEESNRAMISRLAFFHLAPTSTNQENLIRENVPSERIFVAGNTAIDALQDAADMEGSYGVAELDQLEADPAVPVVVVTAHRRENWGGGLERIGAAIAELAHRFETVKFVLPLHPNPAVASILRSKLDDLPNVIMVASLAYVPFARLLKRACLVITDSGGIQEEAPAVGTPVLVLRESTERQEGVDAGTLKLVGTNVQRIVAEASALLGSATAREAMTSRENPYGDGHASERIVAAFEHIAYGTAAPAPYGAGFSRQALRRLGGWDEVRQSDDIAADVEGESSEAVVTKTLQQ